MFYTGARYRATRTTIHPLRPPPAPKGREGKGTAEAPSSPSATPPLREKGVSTYIGHCSDCNGLIKGGQVVGELIIASEDGEDLSVGARRRLPLQC